MSYLAQELPKELKDFGKAFDSIACYHGYNDVFYDFIDYTIACFLITGDTELGERLSKKYGNDYPKIRELFVIFLQSHEKGLGRSGWYDGLGIVYETITSRWKSSKMGQFFTPPSIVDLMCEIVHGDSNMKGKLISDPACGSGRLLLASHVKMLGNYQCGQDLDPICAKMTAINMLLHGCVGEVACMDTLAMKWFFSYEINPHLYRFGFPSLVKIEAFEQSIFYVDYQKPVKKTEAEKIKIIEEKIGKYGQFSLF